MKKPKIGIIPGDPSGIGPELIAKLIAKTKTNELADLLLIGDEHVFKMGQKISGCDFNYSKIDSFEVDWTDSEHYPLLAIETIQEKEIKIAEITKESGLSVLQTLDQALELAQRKIIDAIVFGPFNKASMHLAGIGHDDELHYMAEKLGVTGYISELNNLDNIWTSRVTSHIPLKLVAENINENRIRDAVVLINDTLKSSGIAIPKIAVAALNPHAGDNGNFGTEEIDILDPTIQKLKKQNIEVSGPWPSDTVFLKAINKEIDAVVTMYHDQGQIALKLLGFDRGVTVQGGLSFPITTPAHGTAFDIAGRGVAEVNATRKAFELACKMVAF